MNTLHNALNHTLVQFTLTFLESLIHNSVTPLQTQCIQAYACPIHRYVGRITHSQFCYTIENTMHSIIRLSISLLRWMNHAFTILLYQCKHNALNHTLVQFTVTLDESRIHNSFIPMQTQCTQSYACPIHCYNVRNNHLSIPQCT